MKRGCTIQMRVTDEEIVAASLTHRTNVEAAQAVGMSRGAFYKRLARPEVKALLREAKEGMVRSAITAAQTRSQDAILTIGAVMEDADNPPQVRLNAADMLLRHMVRLTETGEIMDRLAALEDAVGRG